MRLPHLEQLRKWLCCIAEVMNEDSKVKISRDRASCNVHLLAHNVDTARLARVPSIAMRVDTSGEDDLT